MISNDDMEAMKPVRVFNREQTLELWNSGFVNRWHCNDDPRLRLSGDMNGGHCQRVAILYLGLFMWEETSHDTLFNNLACAILHDAPERISGDIPQPGKQRVPELGIGDKTSERQYWKDLGLPNWSRKTQPIGLCDLLDAIMFARKYARDMVDESAAWASDRHLCLTMAGDYGLEGDVDWLIRNVS